MFGRRARGGRPRARTPPARSPTKSGRLTKSMAMTMPARFSVKKTPTLANGFPMTPCAPNTMSRAMPAAVCGMTRGTSTTPWTTLLPRKPFRASRYDSGVPSTKAIAVAMKAARKVIPIERRTPHCWATSASPLQPPFTIVTTKGRTRKMRSSPPRAQKIQPVRRYPVGSRVKGSLSLPGASSHGRPTRKARRDSSALRARSQRYRSAASPTWGGSSAP